MKDMHLGYTENMQVFVHVIIHFSDGNGACTMEDKWMEAYRDFLVTEDKAKSTISTYIRQARRFVAACGKHPENRSVVEHYVDMLKRQYKPATVNLYAIAINSYLKWSRNEDMKIHTKKLKKMFVLENVISDEDYRMMLDYARETGREKYYYIMKVLAGTGIRVGELRYITVENVKRGRGVVYNKGKYREIFISSGLQNILMEYCQQRSICQGAIFTGTKGSVLSRSAVWQMLMKIADRAGVDKAKAHPHSFRHFFAKTYINKCGDITALANIMGHNSLETTRIYTMRTGEEIREQMDALGL